MREGFLTGSSLYHDDFDGDYYKQAEMDRETQEKEAAMEQQEDYYKRFKQGGDFPERRTHLNCPCWELPHKRRTNFVGTRSGIFDLFSKIKDSCVVVKT